MNEKYFAVRTVRKGTVRIGRRTFSPSQQFLLYDGRLDGQRFAFSRYLIHSKPGYEPFVALWGTEADFRDPSSISALEGSHLVDGCLVWEWWSATP